MSILKDLKMFTFSRISGMQTTPEPWLRNTDFTKIYKIYKTFTVKKE